MYSGEPLARKYVIRSIMFNRFAPRACAPQRCQLELVYLLALVQRTDSCMVVL